MRFSILILAALLLAASTMASAEEAHFLKAIDGDSILVEVNGIRAQVRLIGVDAPEYDQAPWGDRAKAFVQEFCSHGLLDLEYDLDKYDPWNRLLAYVWLNGRMLNEDLARAGLAYSTYYKPNKKHLETIKAAVAQATNDGAGFWAQGGMETTPKEWRKHKRQ